MTAPVQVTRCGGRVRETPQRRGRCRCEHTELPPDSVCLTCGGSLWECCGRADSEPHALDCHTLQNDVGIQAFREDPWRTR